MDTDKWSRLFSGKKPRWLWLCINPFRAHGERQPLSISLSSPRMKKPATYRSNLSSRASLPRVVQRSGVAISFCPEGIPLGHSAPSSIVPAGKLNTTQTMLPSGEGLKNGILYGFCLISRRSILPQRDPILSDFSARRA